MNMPIKRICGIIHRHVACRKCKLKYWLGPESFKRSAAIGFVCEDCSDSMNQKEIIACANELVDHVVKTRPDIVEQVERETGKNLNERKR